ncbi:uncharacterized protein MEPE_01788 [Melanopsichium pennsylvanicum]|uniref:Serum paraoxonase/arylesterase n=2 Tax=Melanopsichium pennsylvanicum TaxID=63383 RepID=A0AAJ4XJB9_9BASI|nr:putative protein [Melanopsichium pennsylvanicum 4]SNX83082.1 uncharacterized protein MEPE_01788 [Melanopsichium pennsylvanicum]
MLVPLLISSVAAGLLAVTSYFPYKNHLKLHGAALDATTLNMDHKLNLEHCQPLSTRLLNEPAGPVEPSFCEDIVLDRRTGIAYLSCDPTRLTWDARAGVYEDGSDKLSSEWGTPGIWAWDTNKRNLARKLYISLPPPEFPVQAPADLLTTFHPLGIAVTANHPYFVQESDQGADPKPEPPANLVIVANKPYAHRPGVIDIFVHDLDKVGGKDHTTLRWIRRVQGEDLKGIHADSDDNAFSVDPFRIAIFAEQYSETLERDYPDPTHVKENPNILAGFKDDDVAAVAGRSIRIPSFFVTSLPDRSNAESIPEPSCVFSAVWQPVASYLLPQFSLAGHTLTRKLFLHHSSVNKTLSVRLDGTDPEQWQGFPPLIQVWDGGGKAAGSNSSATHLFIPTLTADQAKVQEWEQHWVRGIGGGIRDHKVHHSETTADGKINNILRLYKTYTPSFVNFFAVDHESPIRALVVDQYGRSWTGSSPNTRAVEQWIASQRDERRRRLGLESCSHWSQNLSSSEKPARPAGRIEQTTYVFRHFGSVVAHPWETEKLKLKKEKGVWLRKEFHTFNVFKSPAETKAEIQGRSDQELKQRGFLPTIPTGLAVDIKRKLLYVTGAYEERGIAVCALPKDWIEE